MKLICLFFIAIIASTNLYSQELPEFLENGNYEPHNEKLQHEHINCKHHYSDKLMSGESIIDWRPYDVLNYDLFLDWTGPLSKNYDSEDYRHYNGVNKIKIKIDSANTQKVEFDARGMIIENVQVNGADAVYSFNNLKGIIDINLGKTPEIGEEFNITIFYEYVHESNIGAYFYPKHTFSGWSPYGDSLFTLENIAYTSSEPENARYWMPCNDNPHDKAYSKISIKVPEGYQAASNGLLKNVITADGASTYYWEHEFPIATYLMVATASKFYHWKEDYTKKTNDETIEILYYVWEDDYEKDFENDTLVHDASKAFANTTSMIDMYSGYYGEYPYEKYGIVALDPYNIGGMEHQTLSTIHRNWLYGTAEVGLAHELSHHWLGDKITCATWSDLWINEGGATWSEAIFVDPSFGDYYYEYMDYNARVYFRRDIRFGIPIYGIPTGALFSNPYYQLSYQKASWIYHMLSEIYGRDNFLSALRYMMDKYAFESIEAYQFIETLDEFFTANPVEIAYDFDLYQYFDQWLFSAGHPIYDIDVIIHSAFPANPSDEMSSSCEVTLTQLQKQLISNSSLVPETFDTPVTLKFYADDELKHTETVFNSEVQETFFIDLDFVPDTVVIDKNTLLCQMNNYSVEYQTDVEVNEDASWVKISPNPAYSGNYAIASININKAENVNIGVYDISGRSLMLLSNETLDAGQHSFSINTANLPAGIYIVKYIIGNRLYTKKLTII